MFLGNWITEAMRIVSSHRGHEDSIECKSIDEIIVKFGHAQCHDVRDRVYGLLGLTDVPFRENRGIELMVDYWATPATLFVRLLSNLPYVLKLSHALNLFDILKLHHNPNFQQDVNVPDSVLSLDFEVGFTHLGHIRHRAEPHPSICRNCRSGNRGKTILLLN